MANKKQKSNVGIKIAAVVLAAAVAAGGVCTLGYASRSESGRWFSKTDFSQWSLSNNLTADAGTGDVFTTPAECYGMSLMSERATLAEYSELGVTETNAVAVFTVIAKYTPAETTHKDTTFTAVWKDPQSAWANGKNVSDYVTIKNVTGDSTNSQAVLTVLKNFGEEIIVKATWNEDEKVFATMKVNCIAPILINIGAVNTIDQDIPITVTFGTGTVKAQEYYAETYIYNEKLNATDNADFYIIVDANGRMTYGDAEAKTVRDFIESLYAVPGEVGSAEYSAKFEEAINLLLDGQAPSALNGSQIFEFKEYSSTELSGVHYRAKLDGKFYDGITDASFTGITLTDWGTLQTKANSVDIGEDKTVLGSPTGE